MPEETTTYCLISGCTPEIVHLVREMCNGNIYGPVLTQALRDLSDDHESFSQNDLSVIGPIHPSGRAYQDWQDSDSDSYDEFGNGLPDDFVAERDIRVLPHCVMGELWDDGYVDAPPPNKSGLDYKVVEGRPEFFMTQTHSMDILELATEGRMSALRLWRLATRVVCYPTLRRCFQDIRVNYGDGIPVAEKSEHQEIPDPFPGFTEEQLMELEQLGEVELVKQRLVHEGKFWTWMAPDRFPVLPTLHDLPAPILTEVGLCENHSTFEKLPIDILICITSHLPLSSLVNLAKASRLLRTNVFGNDYLAHTWMLTSAPWWIPVPTRTPRTVDPETATAILPYLATKSIPCEGKVQRYPTPTSFDWAYVRRCARSGSMLNRRRIWNTALSIERAADTVRSASGYGGPILVPRFPLLS